MTNTIFEQDTSIIKVQLEQHLYDVGQQQVRSRFADVQHAKNETMYFHSCMLNEWRVAQEGLDDDVLHGVLMFLYGQCVLFTLDNIVPFLNAARLLKHDAMINYALNEFQYLLKTPQEEVLQFITQYEYLDADLRKICLHHIAEHLSEYAYYTDFEDLSKSTIIEIIHAQCNRQVINFNSLQPFSAFLQRLEVLRHDTSLADAILVCENEEAEFGAHTAILRFRCEYFDIMLQTDATQRISMQYLSQAMINYLLDYIYLAKIDLSHSSNMVQDLTEIAFMADRLLLTDLKNMMMQALHEYVDEQNAVELLEASFLLSPGSESLRDVCVSALSRDIFIAMIQQEKDVAYRSWIAQVPITIDDDDERPSKRRKIVRSTNV